MKNKKNGFSLVELLAVIVIMGIIAVIAIPLVDFIVKQSKEAIFKSTVENVIDEIKNECRNDIVEKNNAILNYKFTKKGAIPEIDIDGNLPTMGSIELDNECNVTLVNVSDGVYKASLDSNKKLVYSKGTISSSTTEPLYDENWELVDNNANGIVDLGDIISIRTERFYIISNDGENVNALAEHCLRMTSDYTDEGAYLQMQPGDSVLGNSCGSGYCSYSTINSITPAPQKSASISSRLSLYKNKLSLLGISISDIRLIKQEELINLGCILESYDKRPYTCIYAPEWVYSEHYWAETHSTKTYTHFVYETSYSGKTVKNCGSSNSTDCIWAVLYNGDFDAVYYTESYVDSSYSNILRNGIRPVITVPLAEINTVIK